MSKLLHDWVRSKIPTWFLIYLVSRNYRLRQAGHKRDKWYWADLEISRRDVTLCPNCFNQIDFAERCPFCYPPVLGPEKPVGVPEWLLSNPRSFGYEDESEGGSRDDL